MGFAEPQPNLQFSLTSLADAFAELRQLCVDENYILETPARCSDRPIPFAEE